MSNGSAVRKYQPARRSTRINQAIPVVVGGVDSRRGPYREEVSTITISAHGCHYESKYEVLPNAAVVLELEDGTEERGHVKWTKRPPEEVRGLYQTAIELDEPGNVWRIDTPPSDWLPFCGPRTKASEPAASVAESARPKPAHAEPAKSGTVTVLKPAAALAAEERAKASQRAREQATTEQVGQLMGGFQQQMERMLSDAAQIAVREKTAEIWHELRGVLRQDAKQFLAEATASQAAMWVEQSVKELKQAEQEQARAQQAEWKKKINEELRDALGQMEIRQQELQELSSNLTANTLERIQEALEASPREVVTRIVQRLKEQVAPTMAEAKQTAADMAKQRDDLEKGWRERIEKSSAEFEKTCRRMSNEFEAVIREKIADARENLAEAASAATEEALARLRTSAKGQETEEQRRLHDALARTTEAAMADLMKRAGETSQQFAAEMKNYSRNHLDFVSGAISELAKGIGKLSKD